MKIRLSEIEACAWWSTLDANHNPDEKLWKWTHILPQPEDDDENLTDTIDEMIVENRWEGFCEEVCEKVGKQLSGALQPDEADAIEIHVPDDIKDLLEEHCYF